jgi:AGZA family xanthine/uracil permease-like MFS transporter
MSFIQKLSATDHPVNVSKELVAAGTTFLAMAYVTIVNPAILSDAGMDFGAVFVATCLAAGLGSMLMGLVGRLPVGLAPGMGQNAFFSYVIVIGMGHPWQTALGAVFVSGVIFVLISIFPIREWLINSIPMNLKRGISAGIGFFIGFIALQSAGVIEGSDATMVTMADVARPETLFCFIGFTLIIILSARRVFGAIILGILTASILGWVTGVTEFGGVFSAPPSIAPVFLELDIMAALEVSLIPVILAMLLVDVFDTAGTLVAVSQRAGLTDRQGNITNLRGALLADSSATVIGSMLGTSSTTSYIESSAGVEAGGRSGLTAIFVGVFFLLAIFLAPLAQSVPAYATAAALLFVACLMVSSLGELNWQEYNDFVPAVLGAMAMPLTFSIADGIGIAFISYALIRAGSWGQIMRSDWPIYFIAVLFLAKFIWL